METWTTPCVLALQMTKEKETENEMTLVLFDTFGTFASFLFAHYKFKD